EVLSGGLDVSDLLLKELVGLLQRLVLLERERIDRADAPEGRGGLLLPCPHLRAHIGPILHSLLERRHRQVGPEFSDEALDAQPRLLLRAVGDLLELEPEPLFGQFRLGRGVLELLELLSRRPQLLAEAVLLLPEPAAL